MSTRPQPVPWHELADIRGDLLEWLVQRGYAKAKEDPLRAACAVIGREPPEPELAQRVGRGLFDLELFAGHDERLETLGDRKKLGQSDATNEEWRRAYDDSVEQQTDRAIRGLQPKFEHIQRLLKKVVGRSIERIESSDFVPHVKERSKDAIQQQLEDLTTLVNLMSVTAAQLHEEFLDTCPAVDRWPQTLTGWRDFKKALKEELADLDIDWSC